MVVFCCPKKVLWWYPWNTDLQAACWSVWITRSGDGANQCTFSSSPQVMWYLARFGKHGAERFILSSLLSKSEWTLRDVVCTYVQRGSSALRRPCNISGLPQTALLQMSLREKHDVLDNDMTTSCSVPCEPLTLDFCLRCSGIRGLQFTCSWWISAVQLQRTLILSIVYWLSALVLGAGKPGP